jgi:hypothetical protein
LPFCPRSAITAAKRGGWSAGWRIDPFCGRVSLCPAGASAQAGRVTRGRPPALHRGVFSAPGRAFRRCTRPHDLFRKPVRFSTIMRRTSSVSEGSSQPLVVAAGGPPEPPERAACEAAPAGAAQPVAGFPHHRPRRIWAASPALHPPARSTFRTPPEAPLAERGCYEYNPRIMILSSGKPMIERHGAGGHGANESVRSPALSAAKPGVAWPQIAAPGFRFRSIRATCC